MRNILGVNGRIMIKRVINRMGGGRNRIHLPQNRGKKGADVDMVMNLQFPHNVRDFLTKLGSTMEPG